MAWSTLENDTFFQRIENLARSIKEVLNESQELKDIAANPNTVLAAPTNGKYTVAEAGNLRTNVIDPLLDMYSGNIVSQRNRVDDLSTWLV